MNKETGLILENQNIIMRTLRILLLAEDDVAFEIQAKQLQNQRLKTYDFLNPKQQPTIKEKTKDAFCESDVEVKDGN